MTNAQTHRFETFVVCSALADSLTLQRHHRRSTAHTDRRPAVVVGVDGLPGALKAVTWAAIEAELRRAPLRLVFAVDPLDDASAGATPRRPGQFDGILLEAAARARSASSSIDVTAEVVYAPLPVALGRDAAVMICLGSNGTHVPHPGHRVGVTTEVLLKADCPVTIVRGDPLADGWVVARLGCEPTATDLLRIAVEESVLRRMPLRLLVNWPAEGGASDSIDLDARLDRELSAWATKLPGLDVAVERGVSLAPYLHDRADQIALFIAADRQTHDIGTILHPDAEYALGALRCPIMLHAGAARLVPTPARKPQGRIRS